MNKIFYAIGLSDGDSNILSNNKEHQMKEQEIERDIQRLTKYRDDFMNDYETYNIDICNKVACLDVIIRMTNTIQTLNKELQMRINENEE